MMVDAQQMARLANYYVERAVALHNSMLNQRLHGSMSDLPRDARAYHAIGESVLRLRRDKALYLAQVCDGHAMRRTT